MARYDLFVFGINLSVERKEPETKKGAAILTIGDKQWSCRISSTCNGKKFPIDLKNCSVSIRYDGKEASLRSKFNVPLLINGCDYHVYIEVTNLREVAVTLCTLGDVDF